jgi:RHS repeat-associated protein
LRHQTLGTTSQRPTSSRVIFDRYYDPTTGQFLTRDPVEAFTQQPYLYAFGNPVNLIDPSGLCAESQSDEPVRVLLDNSRENEQFREAVRRCEAIIGRGLSRDEKQRLHRVISGQGYSLDEIVAICVDMFETASPPWAFEPGHEITPSLGLQPARYQWIPAPQLFLSLRGGT